MGRKPIGVAQKGWTNVDGLLSPCSISGPGCFFPYISNLRLVKFGSHDQDDIFCVAGFRPGRRGPFVLAKGPKTIDAPSGLMEEDGRQPEEGGSTRYAHTRPASR